MPVKLAKFLKGSPNASGVDSAQSELEGRFETVQRKGSVEKGSDFKDFANLYYDLATDFYEYGWGRSFHFAPRVPGESFEQSLVRHERFLADQLELKSGMVVADLGCGIGGPLMQIAGYSGAKIVGVNSNAYQLERARELSVDAGMTEQAEFMECDFLNVDAPDSSFDAVYAIEATCHAPDKHSIYSEVFRILKPGGHFGNYEYVLTDKFDARDPHHLQVKADIELGGGLLDIDFRQTVDDAVHSVGFEVLELRDLAVQTGPSIPWYQPLAGSGISLARFRSSRIGRSITTNSLKLMETLRIAPRGSARVAENLNLCAAAMVEAGRLGIFSPMYFIHARKPE